VCVEYRFSQTPSELPHATKGRDYRRCSCPLSVEGTLPDGLPVGKALNITSWELASEMVRVMETGGPTAAVKVSEAVERFLADAAARKLSEASLKKYRVLLQGKRKSERASPTLEQYAEDKGYLLLKAAGRRRPSRFSTAVEGRGSGRPKEAGAPASVLPSCAGGRVGLAPASTMVVILSATSWRAQSTESKLRQVSTPQGGRFMFTPTRISSWRYSSIWPRLPNCRRDDLTIEFAI